MRDIYIYRNIWLIKHKKTANAAFQDFNEILIMFYRHRRFGIIGVFFFFLPKLAKIKRTKYAIIAHNSQSFYKVLSRCVLY